jgi:pimeloyl-ACP methyl ester carboxylesterase
MKPLRKDLQFHSVNAHCSAWLYTPAAAALAPVIIMAHGLGGVREMRLDAYAERFCAAGYACLVFDYRFFGSSEGEPRQLIDVRAQLEDWASAIAFARTCKDVDGSQVILWGTSLSGGHVITTAAHQQDIAAVVSQCPFTEGLASVLVMNKWSAAKVSLRAIGDVVAGILKLPPLMVSLAGKPGSTSLMPVKDFTLYLQQAPQHSTFCDKVCARIGLKILFYNPGRDASKATCPIFFAICQFDSVAPAAPTQRYARNAPYAEAKAYPCGHFEFYLGEHFETAVADQLAFLGRHVPLSVKH